jgi:alpha-L-rhamnosidase
MTNNGEQGYEHWRKNGATTFHEYWDSNRSRSHSHPMFGLTVAYIFEYLLGIRQTEDSVGYTSVVINPQAVDRFGWMRGSIRVAAGDIAVEYKKDSGKVIFSICVPEGVEATFRFADKDTELSSGLNEITV